jgi:hypothetical protein
LGNFPQCLAGRNHARDRFTPARRHRRLAVKLKRAMLNSAEIDCIVFRG